MRIGYLGPEGTFSEEALHTWPGKKGAEEVPYPLLPELIESIASGTIDKAIVPLENSIEGTVYLCLDALMEFEELNIEGEIIIPIEHHLAARPETKTIEAIFSHPQALAQCRRFIKQQFPQAKLHPTASTAEAARLVSQKRGPFAAIASQRAIQLFDLHIVSSQIQDYPGNKTRFVVLGKEPSPPTGRDKTSLVFALLGNRPGILYEALAEFAHRSIDLTKIESRPTKQELGEYLFYIDCQGHQDEEPLRTAINCLRRQSSFLRVLGSYPRWEGR